MSIDYAEFWRCRDCGQAELNEDGICPVCGYDAQLAEIEEFKRLDAAGAFDRDNADAESEGA
jgi:rubrerythrin